jgi:16S rRNA (guanine527-N7)-methyltransferase
MSEESEFKQLLSAKLRPYCLLATGQLDLLYHHYSTMCRWNRAMSLTTVKDLESAVERHYCESVFAALNLPAGTRTVADIGSGAGFPGFPMAVYLPDTQFVLIESQQKKASFLREASHGLNNIEVKPIHTKAWSGHVDTVVSRAVRPLEVLSLLPDRANAVLLMLGEDDLPVVIKARGFRFDEPIRVPWGEHRILLQGCCST